MVLSAGMDRLLKEWQQAIKLLDDLASVLSCTGSSNISTARALKLLFEVNEKLQRVRHTDAGAPIAEAAWNDLVNRHEVRCKQIEQFLVEC
jgi:hypothetical protein